ncbi:MAG: RDD family protein [Bacillota bacterium]
MHCPRCGAPIADDQYTCSKCGYFEEIAVIAKLKEAAPKPETPAASTYAGFFRRGAAFILDYLILFGLEILSAGVIAGIISAMSVFTRKPLDFHIISGFAGGFGAVLAVAIHWGYFTGFETSKYRATPGKRMMGIYVTDLDQKGLFFGQANIRYWAKILSMLPLFSGFILAGLTKKKRALHDFIAGTIVLKDKKPELEITEGETTDFGQPVGNHEGRGKNVI